MPPRWWAAFNAWRTRCRVCDSDGIARSLISAFPNLVEDGRFKTVRRYRCSACGATWLLPDDAPFLLKCHKPACFEQWSRANCAPTEAQQRMLEAAGGVMAADGEESFPCALRLPDGSRIERALVIATRGAVFGKLPVSDRLMLLEPAHVLMPSPEALPLAVRRASRAAPEVSMGWAPLNVRDARGNAYTLSGPVDFFNRAGVLGQEISLDESGHPRKNRVQPATIDAYLICDPLPEASGARPSIA